MFKRAVKVQQAFALSQRAAISDAAYVYRRRVGLDRPEASGQSAPMSSLARSTAVSADQIAAFRRDGYVRCNGLLDPMRLAEVGHHITRLTIALNRDHRPLAERSTYNQAFLQVMNLWQHDPVARAFVNDAGLAEVAAGLLEVAGVRLYHDQSLYKEPGGGITPAHADQYYWPLASDRTITVWIPLQAVDAEMGPLAFYAGSHHSQFGRDMPISDESEATICAAMEASGFPIHDQPYALGDVSFHGGWTFHRAGANRSVRPRSVMTMIYMDAEMRLAAPINQMQESDRVQWCGDTAIGAVIDGPGNPLLFRRA